MIQDILALLVNVILNKKKLRQHEWEEYDNLTTRILGCSTETLLETSADQLIDKYASENDGMDKLELTAMYLLKVSDDLKDDSLVFRAKLRHEALSLLKYVQKKDHTFSLPRIQIIQLLEKGIQ